MVTASVALAWSGPPGSAPTCPAGYTGCDAPLNVGSTGQTKNGTLYINAAGNALTSNSTNGSWGGVFYGGGGAYAQTAGVGVQGVNTNGANWGGYFTGGYGAYGQGAGGYGIYGYSSGNIGVYGQTAANSYGGYFYAPASGGVGVRGDGNAYGVYGYNTQTGIYGMLGNSNYSLYGNGDIYVGGRLGTNGYSPIAGYPSGWGGGIHTWDIYGEGTIAAGKSGSIASYLGSDGTVSGSSIHGSTICIGSDCRSAWPAAGYSPNQNVDNGSSPTFSDPYVNNWLRINGSGGIYWQAYGGGWYMQDGTWIRSYNNKPVYMAAGLDTGSASGIGCGGGLGGGYMLRVCGTLLVSSSVTATSYYYSSDARLKKDVKPLSDSLASILALKPVTYEWKDSSHGAGEQLGFIAQDVQAVVPDIVHEDPSTGMLSVDYAKVTPLLVGAVQAQDNEIAALKAQVASQAAELANLEQKVNALAR